MSDRKLTKAAEISGIVSVIIGIIGLYFLVNPNAINFNQENEINEDKDSIKLIRYNDTSVVKKPKVQPEPKENIQIIDTLPVNFSPEYTQPKEGIKLILDEKAIYFSKGSYSINDFSKKNLKKLTLVLQKYIQTTFKIRVFTYENDSAIYNKQLALNRATAIKNYFLENGIIDERFEICEGINDQAVKYRIEIEVNILNEKD